MNSRSRVSRLASSAPSQRIAGPSRVSSARSGPTANGISTTTVRKNNTPISAPPPTRSAILMSLLISAARAVIPSTVVRVCLVYAERTTSPNRSLPPCRGPQGGREQKARRRVARSPARSRCAPDPQFARGSSQWRMGCGDDQAAARKMIAHQGREHALPGGIERVGRLVQEPDRPPRHNQPGDREPPPLSGRQVRRRKIRGMIEPDRGKACPGIEYLAAEEIPPER